MHISKRDVPSPEGGNSSEPSKTITPEDFGTRDLIKQALKINRELRTRIPDSLFFDFPLSSRGKYAQEFMTITLSPGRRTGLTSAMLALCGDPDVIVLSSDYGPTDFRNRLSELGKDCFVLPFDRIGMTRQVRHPVVWVDRASAFSTEDRDSIYEHFLFDKDQTFVFLG